ncbi:hydroxysqualene dehydroxylase HpnE [Massilia endophytica]|uniref:hydroxysqualene dehydroxylase HpnE n=1 Tax=Massilia endophytica TaxID=2899220 RepID=UPI001E45F420|nr:hydroxysqualene dehydroxylase HpnE [Massilia endophytica]UGQ48510.1 hydroxysqualene dehydroxylase HpnE [Massilia endophytica]
MAKRVAVVGGGWAGCAAAMELARGGAQVTLFEAARTLGGRARRISADGRTLDNGQHILLGAYSESLRLMKLAGVDTRAALLNLPLQMRYPAGSGMDFVAPRLPAPLHLAAALLRAQGLDREDKLSLARFSTTARWMGWQLDKDCSVSELLERYDQTPRLIALMWRPLCLAALNTPPERASAKVFLAVLRDSLGARRAASDMLIPRVDLSALFPDAAAAWLRQRGATVNEGVKVGALRNEGSVWKVNATGASVADGWEGEFDGVVLAASPLAAASLLPAELERLKARLAAFEPEPITTCYLQYAPSETLPLPFCALVDDPKTAHWGQFVFDRGQLDPAQKGLFAVVISASGAASDLPQQELAALLAAQLAAVFGRPPLAQPVWSRVVTEKRATFACTPGLERPANDTGLSGLWLAGDYTAGEYPATIEMAVRSGVEAARGLLSGGAR